MRHLPAFLFESRPKIELGRSAIDAPDVIEGYCLKAGYLRAFRTCLASRTRKCDDAANIRTSGRIKSERFCARNSRYERDCGNNPFQHWVSLRLLANVCNGSKTDIW